MVTRAWTHLLATVADSTVDPATLIPELWQAHVRELIGRSGPPTMTDDRPTDFRDWSGGYDPGSSLDRAVHATRTEVFPYHGLDPMP